ncbi:hypothetical protein BH10PSE4_BH10PSE4_33100 [soil metagenome]
MTQTDIPAWRQAIQAKLMAALDAAWAILEHCDDPAEIRRIRDKAKALGDLAALARKVAAITPLPRAKPVMAGLGPVWDELETALAPVAPQAEIARRALDKLKGGRRGRL